MNDRLDDFGDEVDGVEVEDTVTVPAVDPVPEPAPVEPAPVEPVVDPVPEPQPEPQPEPAPVPVVDEEFDGETLNRMAAHLRKREKLAISIDDAMWKILTDPVTKAEYKKLKDLGKF